MPAGVLPLLAGAGDGELPDDEAGGAGVGDGVGVVGPGEEVAVPPGPRSAGVGVAAGSVTSGEGAAGRYTKEKRDSTGWPSPEIMRNTTVCVPAACSGCRFTATRCSVTLASPASTRCPLGSKTCAPPKDVSMRPLNSNVTCDGASVSVAPPAGSLATRLTWAAAGCAWTTSADTAARAATMQRASRLMALPPWPAPVCRGRLRQLPRCPARHASLRRVAPRPTRGWRRPPPG